MDIIHNVPSYVKIEPYGHSQDVNVVAGASTVAVRAVAGDTLDFYFPKGYIDLKTLSMFFKYFCLPFSVAKSGVTQALPKDAECMIQTLEVFLGGKRVNYISNYNQIFHLLSTYGADAEYRTNRDTFQNVWNNGRTSTTTDLDNVQFCCEKWLGLLGLPVVLDTHTLGQLHIKITLAPAYITTSNSQLHSWGMADLFMRVKYYENYDGDLPNYLEFDDFKSILERSTTYHQKINLIVNSSRIDYALGRTLRSDIYSKPNALAFGTVVTFGTFANEVASWNFTVNNNNIFRYRPTPADGIKTVLDMLPSKSMNAPSVAASGNAAFERHWVCGADLGFVSDIPQQVEIGFVTEGINATGNCFPLLIVKTTSSIEIGRDGQVIHQV
jgi:hypothetical protein